MSGCLPDLGLSELPTRAEEWGSAVLGHVLSFTRGGKEEKGARLCVPCGDAAFDLREVPHSQGHAANWCWAQLSKQTGELRKRIL